jgi:hypothetical protein
MVSTQEEVPQGVVQKLELMKPQKSPWGWWLTAAAAGMHGSSHKSKEI